MLLSLAASAQYRVSGTCYSLPNPQGVDEVLIYEDLSAANAFLEYTGKGTPSWQTFAGTVVQQGVGAETLYPEDAQGYLLYENGNLVRSFFVFDYRQYKPQYDALALTADMQCDASLLTLTGLLPEMRYATTSGGSRVIPREASVTYTTLGWEGTMWQDSLAEETLTLQGGVAQQQLRAKPAYTNTAFTLHIDPFAQQWAGADSLVSDVATAIAVCAHPTSVTTSRDYNGKGVENEQERPIDETTLTGSAPLEVNFIANANKPTALYYRWTIYKGSDLIAERFDEEQRYTFTDFGNYQVRAWAYNDHCTTDSTVFDISISSSVLRVPNVFTPNGDGQNDEFRVVYRSLAEFHCWIYNRWGKLVYKWDDPAKGWDGTINGRPAAEGAYYYIIRARGTDAEAGVKYHKTTKRNPQDLGVYQLSGHINLLRGNK